MAAILIWTTRVLTAALAVLALLPLIPSGQWWVRVWAFPRLQMLGALVVPLMLLGLHAWRARPRVEHAVLLALLLAIAGGHASQIIAYTPLWPVEVPSAARESQQGESRADANERFTLRILTANIKVENTRHDDLLAMVEREDPDLALLIEVDETWAKALAPLDARYPHRVGVVRDEGLGIVLWSRLPLRDAEVRYLVTDRRPSIFATLETPGDIPLRYVGVHPTPPGLRDRVERNGEDGRRDSRVRDAELILVARTVRQHPDPRWLVTGDFNDVAWSHTTKLFQDLADLKDPRVGRRLLNTYHAQQPLWRYPIDHVFVSDGLHLHEMDRVRAPGSDHFAITAAFTLNPKDHAPPKASEQDREKAQDVVDEGTRDAEQHDVSDDDSSAQ